MNALYNALCDALPTFFQFLGAQKLHCILRAVHVHGVAGKMKPSHLRLLETVWAGQYQARSFSIVHNVIEAFKYFRDCWDFT